MHIASESTSTSIHRRLGAVALRRWIPRWRRRLGAADPGRRRRLGAARIGGSGGAGAAARWKRVGAPPRRDSARRFGRNRRRRTGGTNGGRRRKEVGKGRGLKCPSRQPLSWDTGHRRGEAETCVFAGWGRDFAAPLKKFYGPAAFARSVRAGFFTPSRIFAVILWVGAFYGVC
jgi:hypothetical protein